MYAYHVVTDRPLKEGQQLIFDEAYHTTKCFDAQLDEQENLRLAEIYWKNESNDADDPPIVEMLVDGHIKVIEMIKEINANIK